MNTLELIKDIVLFGGNLPFEREEEVRTFFKQLEQRNEKRVSVDSIVSGSLSIKEVASKYGEKKKCMFCDYDDNWVEKQWW